jgi:hypothetical protein
VATVVPWTMRSVRERSSATVRSSPSRQLLDPGHHAKRLVGGVEGDFAIVVRAA